jgi:hypothetical protein
MFLFAMALTLNPNVVMYLSFQPVQAPKCTVVTSSRRLPEKVRAWLRNSNAEHCLITNRTMKRLGVGRTFWEIAGN